MGFRAREEGNEAGETYETRRRPDVPPSEDDARKRPETPNGDTTSDDGQDVERDGTFVDGTNVVERGELGASLDVGSDGLRFEAAVGRRRDQ
jgi:transposase